MGDVWLVRHGQTEWSARRRHTSTTDLALTADGESTAQALAPRLAEASFELVLTSPRVRARRTAELAGFPAAEVDPDLVEWDYGDYEGVTTDEIRESVPGWTVWSHPCPGGETAAEVSAPAGPRGGALPGRLRRCAAVRPRALPAGAGRTLARAPDPRRPAAAARHRDDLGARLRARGPGRRALELLTPSDPAFEPVALTAGCPRCPTPVASTGTDGWSCPEHGVIPPLWRPDEASYDAFVEHLGATARFPTYLPWPLSPGWRVTDFAAVGDQTRGRAAMTCVSGTSALDGPVDVLVVSEEPGTGLGARIAGTVARRPGPGDRRGAPDGAGAHRQPDRPAVAGVDQLASSGSGTARSWPARPTGRWLWMVLRPASAVLLLRDDWILRDVSGLGPPLVELPFGGPAPAW